MRIIYFFLSIFLFFEIQAQTNSSIKIKQLGLIDKNGYYTVLDACSKLDVSINNFDRFFFLNRYFIKGQIVSAPFFFDGCKTKYCKDIEYKIPILIFKGTNDEINRKITILKKFNIDCCGRFKIWSKFKKGENIYLYSEGYSLLEIRID
jgi:hypothetical protein